MSPQEQARAVLHRERLEGNDICRRRALAAGADRTDCMNSLYIIISFPAVLSVVATLPSFPKQYFATLFLGGKSDKITFIHLPHPSFFFKIFFCLFLHFVQQKNLAVVLLVSASILHSDPLGPPSFTPANFMSSSHYVQKSPSLLFLNASSKPQHPSAPSLPRPSVHIQTTSVWPLWASSAKHPTSF